MYKSFYSLNRSPFETTPDPSFLFPTDTHDRALSSLYQGVQRRKGIMVLTGEVGTGKTLILRTLLELMEQAKDVNFAYLFNGRLSVLDFLRYIATDLGVSQVHINGKKGQVLLGIVNHVIACSQKKLTTVLIIDEAHHLSEEILEEIRLLTNLETPKEKLLQILLVGQPELDEKLDSVSLRQLKQRIAVRARLDPLTSDEAVGYIERRLRVAGCHCPSVLFPPETIAAVYEHSRGFPRLINTVCENALIMSFERRMESVSPDIIDDIATTFRLRPARTQTEQPGMLNDAEMRRAATIMLELNARLKAEKSVKAQSPAGSASLNVTVSNEEAVGSLHKNG